MDCPFCKEEIADGAIKCKHCASLLGEGLGAGTEQVSEGLSSSQASVTEKLLVDPDGHAKIEALNVSASLKRKLHIVQDKIKEPIAGIPDYDLPFTGKLKVYNWWAFFFGIFYYLLKGMWKKAIIIFAAAFILMGLTTAFNFSDALFFGLQVGFCTLLAISANYDIYRKEVLKEDFWW